MVNASDFILEIEKNKAEPRLLKIPEIKPFERMLSLLF